MYKNFFNEFGIEFVENRREELSLLRRDKNVMKTTIRISTHRLIKIIKSR